MKKLFLPFILLGTLMITSCAPNLSSTNYSMDQTNLSNRAVKGVVVSIRPVQVQGSNNGVGAIAGGVAGAVGGSMIGGGTRAHVLGGVGGALLGGLVGNQIQKEVSKANAYEYLVKTKKGNIISAVQAPDSSIAVGQHVIVILSNPAKVVADTTQ